MEFALKKYKTPSLPPLLLLLIVAFERETRPGS